jgi:hypothetical protein
MFEPGITPTLPSPIEGEGFTLSFHGQLFTRHYTSDRHRGASGIGAGCAATSAREGAKVVAGGEAILESPTHSLPNPGCGCRAAELTMYSRFLT